MHSGFGLMFIVNLFRVVNNSITTILDIVNQ